MRRALFLDRDGTLNAYGKYISNPEEFVLLPQMPEIIRKFNQDGWLVIVVTNQAGVARGYYTEGDVQALHKHADALLANYGARVDAWYYCPHHPDFTGPCRCRKPEPGMIEAAIERFGIDPAQSIMVGDKPWDIECGERCWMRSMYVDEFVKEVWP
jgi:D-glycero-D-manno-heptose 1,7-bisphosphate phosphatase